MLFSVGLAGIITALLGMRVMSARSGGVMSRLLVITRFMMFGGFFRMPRGVFIMFRCLFVVLGCFLAHNFSLLVEASSAKNRLRSTDVE
jgi:hypothetical protein